MTTRYAGVKRSFIRLVSMILVFALFISGIVIPGNVMKAEAAASVKWLGYTAYGTVWDVADNSRLKIRPEPGNLDAMSGSLANGTRVAIIGYTDYDPSDPWSPWYAVDIANTALKEPSEYTVGYVSGQFVDVPVTGIQVSTGEKTLKVGTSSGTGHSVIPPCATDRSVTWSSNNTSVATVDANGNVTAHAEGTAVITVRSNNGGHTASCTYTVLPLVSEITLDKYTVTTGIGKSSKVTATVNPSNAFDKSVSWSSNNTAVATVDQNGNITGKSVGTATIAVTANDGSGKSASCTVTVDPLVSTVSLNKDSVTLSVGKTSTLTATVSPENAFDKSVSWSSSDNNVATVNENGVVTAKAAGTAIIKATANDGSDVYDTCVFYVRPLVSSITINDASLFLYVGQGETLSAEVLPENALDRSITWKSSDESVATIDQDGNITTLDDGEVTFSATANDGSGVSAECTYTIEWIPSGIVLSKNKSTLKEKKTEVLTALFDPIAVDREVIWSSSDESVATVDQNGKVTAVSAGTAIITATLTNGSGQSASCAYTVKALVRKIDVKKNPLTMVIGQTEKLTATITPKDVYDNSITWSSSDPTVATVDENGYVKAKSAGTATITAAAKDGSGVVGTSTVVVNAPISWISIDHNYATIVKGNNISLVTTIYPSTATDKSLTWKTSDAKVATVDQNGVVTAVNGGTATITAMSNDGSGKYDTCKVTVIVLVEKITLNKDSLAMSAGGAFDLNETVLPANATDKTVKWSSADPAMVMVGQDGTVLARSGGVVKVRATANDKSGVFAECTVTTNYPRDGWVANISQTSKLNIRKDHNTSSQIITKISYATQLTVTAPAVDGWYPVVLSDGNRGYASADYIVFYKPETMVSTSTGKAPTPTADYPKTGWAGNMKQTSNLNIRTSPNGSVIKSVAYATQFTVTGPAENGWYPVKLSDGRTGYASATYVVFTKPTVTKTTGTNTTKPSSSSTNNKQVAGYPKTAWVGNMTNTSNVLKIRSSKSTASNSNVITKLAYGTQLTVTGPAENGWYPVKLANGKTGYASSQYIVFSKPSKSSSSKGNSSTVITDSNASGYASTMIDVTRSFDGKTVTIKSIQNQKYVTADRETSGVPAYCNRSTAGSWEKFTVHVTSDGWAGFKSDSKGYLSANIGQNKNAAPITATATKIQAWECFKIYKYKNDYYIKSQANGRYLTAVIDEPNVPLKARATSYSSWERFSISIISSSTQTSTKFDKNAVKYVYIINESTAVPLGVANGGHNFIAFEDENGNGAVYSYGPVNTSINERARMWLGTFNSSEFKNGLSRGSFYLNSKTVKVDGYIYMPRAQRQPIFSKNTEEYGGVVIQNFDRYIKVAVPTPQKQNGTAMVNAAEGYLLSHPMYGVFIPGKEIGQCDNMTSEIAEKGGLGYQVWNTPNISYNSLVKRWKHKILEQK